MGVLALFLSIAVIVIIALLGFIAWQLYCSARASREAPLRLALDLSDQIRRLKEVAEHHADVSAVVEMLRQVNHLGQSELELLVSYPETVRTAALVHYANVLGSDLQAAHKSLSAAHRTYSDVNGPSITAAQTKVNAIQAKLDAVAELSDRAELHAV